jgi:hypothetical protein
MTSSVIPPADSGVVSKILRDCRPLTMLELLDLRATGHLLGENVAGDIRLGKVADAAPAQG